MTKSNIFSFRMEPEWLSRLESIADKEHLSKATLVRRWVYQRIETEEVEQ